jgi:hypothetical protein
VGNKYQSEIPKQGDDGESIISIAEERDLKKKLEEEMNK